MRRDRAAFTLLEVLVSIAIASGMAAVAWTGFYQMRQVARRNEVETSLVVDAGFIYRRLADELSGLQAGTQMRFERVALSPAVYGAGAYRTDVFWMRSLPSTNPNNGMADLRRWSEYTFEDVWACWEWRPSKLVDRARGAGALWAGANSASSRKRTYDNTVFSDLTAGQTRSIYGAPQARRDRRRELDDNDCRLMPNASTQPNVRIAGDRSDLIGEDVNLDGVLDPGEDLNKSTVLDLGNIKPLCSRVSKMSLQWVDYGGWTTSLDAANGVVVRTETGSVKPAPGTSWWNADVRCVDGLYRDGRAGADAVGSDTGRSVVLDRPALLRVHMTLTDVGSGIERSFSFSFPLGLESPATTGL